MVVRINIGVIIAIVAILIIPPNSVRGGVFKELNSDLAYEIMRLAKSADMRNIMTPEIAPCDDFYTHACGNWAKINPANENYETDLFSQLNRGYLRRAHRLLAQPKLTTDSVMESRVKYFYESCLNRTALELNYRAYILRMLDEYGGMPALKGRQWKESDFDWQQTMVQILRRYGKETLLSVDATADLNNSQANRLYIGQVDQLVSSQELTYYANYKVQLQVKLSEMLGLNPTRAAQTASEIVDLKFQLARGKSEPQDGLGVEDKVRLRMLDEMTESYKPTINFTQIVASWLGYEYRLPVYEYVESYIWNLRKLVQKTPKRVLANFMLYSVLQEFEIDIKNTDGEQEFVCVDQTIEFFPDYMDHMVYRSLAADSPSTPGDFKQLWQELKSAFTRLLHSPSSEWLDESTRAAALDKLKTMTYRIHGFEEADFERDYETLIISTADYFENVRRILELRGHLQRQKLQQAPSLTSYQGFNGMPSYKPEFNLVQIPASFIQPRYLWDDVYPMAIKYATVGSVIAHEMVHGFDDTLRKYDGRGNLLNWWSRNATDEFNKRKQCLVEQFGGFRAFGNSLPKSQAQGENIADNAGVKIAHSAYMYWLEQQEPHMELVNATEHLPHMTKTPEQLFFLALGQLWCTDVIREWGQSTMGDVHAPPQIRLYAMMANNEEFTKAHQCGAGTNMNPKNKCVIY